MKQPWGAGGVGGVGGAGEVGGAGGVGESLNSQTQKIRKSSTILLKIHEIIINMDCIFLFSMIEF